MRVLLSTYDSRGGIEPLAALAAALTPQTRARARVVADMIRPDGAAVAAKLPAATIAERT